MPGEVTASRWRSRVRAHFGERRRTRYPEVLQRSAVAYLGQRKREGADLGQAAAELGVEAATLERWGVRWPEDAGAEPTKMMLPVVVATDPAARETGAARLVVHGPRGLRVEGLTVGQIAELMEALAC
jgi:transposase-like protein